MKRTEEIAVKLNGLQFIWLVGCTALIATVLLDIAGIIEVPPIYWMAGFGVWMTVGWWVMPSLAELKRLERRPRR